MINLFVVSSPLQLLNAIEARDRFHLSEENVLLLLYTKPLDLDQMRYIIDIKWSKIIVLKLNPVIRIFYPLLLSRMFSGIGLFSVVYLGYPFNVRAHIANKYAQKVVLLDDGTASLLFAENMNGKKSSKALKRPGLADIMLGRKVGTDYLSSCHFFTVYDIALDDESRILKNDYRCLRQRCASKNKEDYVLFVGAPIEEMLVSGVCIARLMKEVRKHYGNKKIVYCLHRRENRDLREKQFKGLDIELILYDAPIECVLAGENYPFPTEVASFFSSALTNINIIYDVGVSAFRFSDAIFREERKEVIRKVYKGFEKGGISIVSIGFPG